MAGKVVRIDGASGFWGDSMVGAPQWVASGMIDYLVFDYLAETTMAILAAARSKRPEMGYATDFVDTAMRQVLPEVMKRGIKLIANAGGIHPQGCAHALQALAASMNLCPRIAVVEGDDVSAIMATLRAQGVCDMFSGEALPPRVLSANAYLGAFRGGCAGRRGGHRDHRPGRGQRRDPGRADPRVRLVARRPRPAGRRQPGRTHHRMRLPGHGRPVHRLAARARLGPHRLSDHRVRAGRQLRAEQGPGNRRAGRPGLRGRADALRDRRPRCLPASGCQL